jgi:hypothetical protein
LRLGQRRSSSTLNAVSARTTLRPHRFRYLLAAELLLIVLYPFIHDRSHPLFGFLALPMVIAGIYVIAEDRNITLAASVVGLFAIAGNFAAAIEGLRSPGLACWMIFSLFVLVVLLRRVLTSGEVTVDILYGAIAAYLLIGVVWGMAYTLLDDVSPRSFYSAMRPGPFTWGDYTFFSFVTLTSVGYGDMMPLSGHAKSLAVLESVTGVMYPAVLVARLIGLHGQGRRRQVGD